MKKRVKKDYPKPPEMKAEFCPEAVIKWYELGPDETRRRHASKEDLIKNAKGHLLFEKWTFSYARKKDRYELRYTSPSKKCHSSLRTACKTCIDQMRAKEDSDRLAAEKDSSFSPESSAKPASLAGKSPIESSNLNFNLAFSRPRKPRRRRRTCFESVIYQSPNDDNCNFHVDAIGESSNNTASSVDLDDSSDQSTCVNGNKKPKIQCGADKKTRVKKIPHIQGFLSHSTASLLSLLIDRNVVELGAKVTYRGKQFSGGEITREGIQCDCCSEIFALTAFEVHVGSTNRRPAAYIMLEDGRSLMDCKIEMNGNGNRMRKGVKNGNKDDDDHESEHCVGGNNEICGLCQLGGEIVMCDGCPASYHLSCLGFETAPDGDWFCPSCRCGVCGQGDNLKEESGISNAAVEDCFGKEDRDLVICHQCERKFHFGCLRNSGDKPNLECGSDINTFCSRKCEDICLCLRSLVGKPIQVGADRSLTWKLLKSRDNVSELSAVLSLIHQCFEPAKDPLTKRDIVEDVVFGRNSELSRLNFKGFYVVILERDDELITVATVRIYGSKVAEMPLVATRFEHRLLGMAHVLIGELEKQLVDLGVERLILPASSEVLETWVNSFGFSEMSVSDRLKFLSYNLLEFYDTVVCQKLLG